MSLNNSRAHTDLSKNKILNAKFNCFCFDMPSFNIFGYWITFEFNTLHFDYDLSLLLLHYVFFKQKFQALFNPLPQKKMGQRWYRYRSKFTRYNPIKCNKLINICYGVIKNHSSLARRSIPWGKAKKA